MVQLQITDEDVILRAARLMDTTTGRRRRPTIGGKIAYFTQASGSKAVGIMLTVYPLMGRRRQERIRELILRWRPRRTVDALRLAEVRELAKSGLSNRQISVKTGLRAQHVWRIVTGKAWAKSHISTA